MQSIMYHPKCHSFSNTITMLFLGDGQEKVVQGIHQHCHYVIFLSYMKPDCEISQTAVERKTGDGCYQSWFGCACSCLLCALAFCVLRHSSPLPIKGKQGALGPEYQQRAL